MIQFRRTASGALIRLSAQKRKVRSPGPALAIGDGRTVSLIPSLIHVRVPASITVYCPAKSRSIDHHGRFWTVILNTQKRKVGGSRGRLARAMSAVPFPSRQLASLPSGPRVSARGCVAELNRTGSRRRRCAAPLARRQRRARPWGGPPGARRAARASAAGMPTRLTTCSW